MASYVALLRGIAPSQPNQTNDKLRAVFVRLGLDGVASVLSSGNILFRSDEPDATLLEARIEAALQRDLGIGGATLLRELAELRALLDSDPFEGLTHGPQTYLTVTFLKDRTIVPSGWPEPAEPGSRVIGYHPAAHAVLAVFDNTAGTPSFMSWLDRTYGKGITTRSWLTVQRIVRRLES